MAIHDPETPEGRAVLSDAEARRFTDLFLEALAEVDVSPTALVYWEQVYAMRKVIDALRQDDARTR